MSQFQHTPLENPDDIRVVELVGGQPNQEIVCRLHVMPGKSSTRRQFPTTASGYKIEKYAALSYTWEGLAPQHQIKLDGKVFHVGQNLHSLLWYARGTEGPYIYWIDAICINQDD